MVSLGLGFLIQNAIQPSNAKLLNRWAFSFLLLFIVAIYGYEVYGTLKKTDYLQETSFWGQMGMDLGMNSKVVALSEDYGYRLAYWGWLSPVNWMSMDDIRLRTESGQGFDFRDYFESTVQDKDYFLVTQMDEWDRQPDLKNALVEKYPLIDESGRFLLFDLKHPRI